MKYSNDLKMLLVVAVKVKIAGIMIGNWKI
jgi:hypothetical protein